MLRTEFIALWAALIRLIILDFNNSGHTKASKRHCSPYSVPMLNDLSVYVNTRLRVNDGNLKKRNKQQVCAQSQKAMGMKAQPDAIGTVFLVFTRVPSLHFGGDTTRDPSFEYFIPGQDPRTVGPKHKYRMGSLS